ncbi:aminotransferase class I/II-fold pyridoxal phosphate-dependent enzyme [Pseudacidovorax sp. RU35E]|uniref:aminotransferase class I/II-fold pyridoxal phosphate-dependent enzyme n=1 Tax=Pseudacidovorax sp. RU35E TaxID=1907403 RepID=UPI000954AF07|nr:aminotransferase class I/II-fold pyridoxal phosphate-dependent enzyme [Pseudacidovorax sp. RU35E]SIP97823.1 histidinol-phosphate aminotransferase [Pseudacidovorax sp. RU35E]
MRATVHGGPDADGVPVHDFSTNANACGPCATVTAALSAADPRRYPDPAATALRGRLAAWHQVAPERVLVAASASEFIMRITVAMALRRRGEGPVQVPVAAYGDYRRAAEAHGLPVQVDDGSRGVTQSPPILAWTCEPSSPRGDAVPDLAARIDALMPATTMVLDCAYAPLRLEGASALTAAQRDRCWQLWTPNKALGLTGVRGAYAIAPAEAPRQLMHDLHALAPSWPLGAHAEAMLQAWTAPDVQEWLVTHCLPALQDWKRRQIAGCEALGWQVEPGVANFFCARPDVASLGEALRRLRAHGIKLRDCGSFGMPGWVRLGVLPPASQDALFHTWKQGGCKQRQGG